MSDSLLDRLTSPEAWLKQQQQASLEYFYQQALLARPATLEQQAWLAHQVQVWHPPVSAWIFDWYDLMQHEPLGNP